MFGLDDIVASGLKIIDRIIPNKAEADAAKLKLLQLQQDGELKEEEFNVQLAQGQVDINKIEAGSDSLFKSGWRPAIGWICAASFCYDFIVRPIANGLLNKYGIVFPSLDQATLTSLTFGLLGLGAYRSFDKLKK